MAGRHARLRASPRSTRFMAPGRPEWDGGPRRLTELLDRRDRARPVEPPLVPLADGGAAAAVRGRPTTSTSTPPSTTPPTSGGSSAPTPSRCCPTGSTCRSATTAGPAPSSSPAPTSSGPCGPAQGARAEARPTGPSLRLDIEAELGFVVGVALARWASAVADRRLRRPRLRRGAGQRLVGARHPGLGVRPARPVPGQVVRHLDLAPGSRRWPPSTPAWTACPARTREPLDYLRVDGPPRGLDIDVEVVAGTARSSRARPTPPCTGRRPRCSPTSPSTARAAHRRPVRLRHRLRPGARPARLVAGAVLGRQEPFTAGGRERTFLEDGDEVTLRYTAPGPAAAGSRSARSPGGSCPAR